MATILLAEDDQSMRRFLKRALEKAGHEVIAVGDGLEALEAFSPGRFNLLLADIAVRPHTPHLESHPVVSPTL